MSQGRSLEAYCPFCRPRKTLLHGRWLQNLCIDLRMFKDLAITIGTLLTSSSDVAEKFSRRLLRAATRRTWPPRSRRHLGQVIARFEVERQALALMDHPNIARVLDAGATETGRRARTRRPKLSCHPGGVLPGALSMNR
jgi:hypothetical protein